MINRSKTLLLEACETYQKTEEESQEKEIQLYKELSLTLLSMEILPSWTQKLLLDYLSPWSLCPRLKERHKYNWSALKKWCLEEKCNVYHLKFLLTRLNYSVENCVVALRHVLKCLFHTVDLPNGQKVTVTLSLDRTPDLLQNKCFKVFLHNEGNWDAQVCVSARLIHEDYYYRIVNSHMVFQYWFSDFLTCIKLYVCCISSAFIDVYQIQ